MKKTGFIVKNKAKGTYYYYLRKSVREGQQVKKINLYSFGNKDKAINKIKSWYAEGLPEELKQLGFEQSDLNEWLSKIEETEV